MKSDKNLQAIILVAIFFFYMMYLKQELNKHPSDAVDMGMAKSQVEG